MAIKTYRPTTQTLRYRTSVTTDDITSSTPHKPLVEGKIRSGGRRNSGDTTMRFRGGGNKRKLRTIDFKRDKHGIPATVETIEYDPGRSARIALLELCRWREALHCAARWIEGWAKDFERTGSGHSGRERVAAAEYSAGHDDSQHRTASWKRRADGALGGRFGAVDRQRRRLRTGEAAFGRDPQGAARLLSDDRAGGEHGPRECDLGQGGTHAVGGKASA